MIVFQVGTSMPGLLARESGTHIMGNNGIIGGEDDWRASNLRITYEAHTKRRRTIINACVKVCALFSGWKKTLSDPIFGLSGVGYDCIITGHLTRISRFERRIGVYHGKQATHTRVDVRRRRRRRCEKAHLWNWSTSLWSHFHFLAFHKLLCFTSATQTFLHRFFDLWNRVINRVRSLLSLFFFFFDDLSARRTWFITSHETSISQLHFCAQLWTVRYRSSAPMMQRREKHTDDHIAIDCMRFIISGSGRVRFADEMWFIRWSRIARTHSR